MASQTVEAYPECSPILLCVPPKVESWESRWTWGSWYASRPICSPESWRTLSRHTGQISVIFTEHCSM